jgi:hypoxanthine phosphoribosyltransferase
MADLRVEGFEPLLSANEVARRVEVLAAAIAPRIDDETIAICLLSGGIWFAADLMRALVGHDRHPLFDALWLSSYEDGRQSTGRVQLRAPPQRSLERRQVLLIDDVVDSGLSLAEAARIALKAGASEVLSAVFAAKPWPRARAREPDFTGWAAPDRFLIGYGMDAAGRYRGLPGVWAAE